METKWQDLLDAKYAYLMDDYHDEENEITVPAGTRCHVEVIADDEIMVIPTPKKYETVEMYYYPQDSLGDIVTEKQYKAMKNSEETIWKALTKATKEAKDIKEMSDDLKTVLSLIEKHKK